MTINLGISLSEPNVDPTIQLCVSLSHNSLTLFRIVAMAMNNYLEIIELSCGKQ